MSNSQFAQLMQRLDEIEKRVRRIEAWSASAGGAIMVVTFLIQQNVIHLGG